MSKVSPTKNWVIVKEIFLEQEAMASGIYINRPNVANTVFGEIMSKYPSSELEVGAKVVFIEYAGGRWTMKGEKALIVPEAAILAYFS